MNAPGRARSRVRDLLGAAAGNLFESYDWQCYLVLSALIAPQFFPRQDPVSDLLGTLMIFAVGFGFRPVGGALFGFLSDRYGRRWALSVSMVLMGTGSLIIGFAPTYSQSGLLAPALLLVARSLQGISAGGEFAAASSYVVEVAPNGARGRYSSSIFATATAGVLFAAVTLIALRAALSPAQLSAWGWRIPFLIGALLALYGFYLRAGLAETPPFLAQATTRRRPSIAQAAREHPRGSLRVMGLTAGATVVFYTFVVYLPSYAVRAHQVPEEQATWVMVGALAVFSPVVLLWGRFADRFGAWTPAIIFSAGMAVATPLLFELLSSTWWSLFGVMTTALLLFAGCAAVLPQLLAEQFPVSVRTIGVGLPYSLAVALFGGTAPYVVESLAAADLGAWFPWYVSALCLVSLWSALSCRTSRQVRVSPT